MSALAILSLAFAVFALGIVVVCGYVLLQAMRRLSGAVKDVSEQVTPLTDELSAELAVTNAEVANLTDGMERFSAERAQARRRREGIRPRKKKKGRSARRNRR